MKKIFILAVLLALGLSSCIKEDFLADFVQPESRILNPVDTIGIMDEYQLEAIFFNNIGLRDNDASLTWSSLSPSIARVTSEGLVTPLSRGSLDVMLVVSDQGEVLLTDTLNFMIGEFTSNTERVHGGMIRTTSSYILTGDFTVSEVDGNLVIEIADNFEAGAGLPGLALFLSNNPNSINGALRITPAGQFIRGEDLTGARTHVVDGTRIGEYSYLLYFCEPFGIKVGDGEINIIR